MLAFSCYSSNRLELGAGRVPHIHPSETEKDFALVRFKEPRLNGEARIRMNMVSRLQSQFDLYTSALDRERLIGKV